MRIKGGERLRAGWRRVRERFASTMEAVVASEASEVQAFFVRNEKEVLREEQVMRERKEKESEHVLFARIAANMLKMYAKDDAVE